MCVWTSITFSTEALTEKMAWLFLLKKFKKLKDYNNISGFK